MSNRVRIPPLLRPIVLAVFLACAAPGAVSLAAAQNAAVISFNIPAGPLDATLTRIARQSGQVISVRPELVQGLKAPAVQGEMSAEQAYRQALQGSGLEVYATGSGALNLRSAPGKTTTLPEVRVTASQEDAWGPVHGYVATRSATATKTDTPLIETPRAVSVVTARQIEDQAATDIDEALRYTSGVAAEYRGVDRNSTDILVRGFDAPVFTDGMRGGTGGYGHLDIDPYALERIEVLKGPASTVYGAVPPGGMVNLVSKRPSRESFTELGVDAGSHSQLGSRFDINRALDEEGRVLARLTGLVRGGDSQIDFEKDNRTFIAPAISWLPGQGTQLTVLARYQKDEGPWATFLPAVGTVLPNPNGRIPTSLQHGEPGQTDGYEREFRSLGYILEHTMASDWLLRHSLRYDSYDFAGRSSSGSGFDTALNDNRTVKREPFYGQEDGDAITLDTNIQKRFATEAAQHTVLLGFDYRQSWTSAAYGYLPADPSWNLDLFNPVRGVVVLPTPEEILRRGAYLVNDQDLSQTGFYAQDQMKIGRWAFTLGGRYDIAKSKTHDKLAATTTRESDNAFTAQAGVVHLFDNGFAPYANYAQSFEPQEGAGRDGAFKPTTGEHVELGLKYETGGGGLVTIAAYETTKQNVLTDDPNSNFEIQTGEVRARGWEVEGKLGLSDNLDVIANYSHVNAKITRSNYGDQGNRPGQTPENVASLWATYRFPEGLTISGGARYTGSTLDYDNVIEVPSVTLYDLALRYDFGGALRGASFHLNAKNLTDEVYVASCEGEFWCIYGLRRVVTAGLWYRW